jgi:hypothetical protein
MSGARSLRTDVINKVRVSVVGKARIRLYRHAPRHSTLLVHGFPVVLVQQQEVSNLIVDTGLAWIVDQLASVPALAPLSHMELGTDGTPPLEGDTALGAPIVGSRLAFATGPTQSGSDLIYSGFWGPGVATNPSIREAGDFNAAVAGTMIGRIAIGPFPKTAEHILLIERTVTFVRGE